MISNAVGSVDPYVLHTIYLASPMPTYGTARYERPLAACGRQIPHAEILEPRSLFADASDWLQRWPLILTTIDALVFFDDGTGIIGYGVWTELHDAERSGKPVLYLADDEQLHAWSDISVRRLSGDNWRRFARVRLRPGTGVR